MRLLTKAALTFVVIGGLAASTVTDRGAFVMMFFVLFFGGIAAVVVGLSGPRAGGVDVDFLGGDDPDPFIDQDGVRHSSPQPVQPMR